MVETLISTLVASIGLGLIVGTIWAFKWQKPYKWILAGALALYVPALLELINLLEG